MVATSAHCCLSCAFVRTHRAPLTALYRLGQTGMRVLQRAARVSNNAGAQLPCTWHMVDGNAHCSPKLGHVAHGLALLSAQNTNGKLSQLQKRSRGVAKITRRAALSGGKRERRQSPRIAFATNSPYVRATSTRLPSLLSIRTARVPLTRRARRTSGNRSRQQATAIVSALR